MIIYIRHFGCILDITEWLDVSLKPLYELDLLHAGTGKFQLIIPSTWTIWNTRDPNDMTFLEFYKYPRFWAHDVFILPVIQANYKCQTFSKTWYLYIIYTSRYEALNQLLSENIWRKQFPMTLPPLRQKISKWLYLPNEKTIFRWDRYLLCSIISDWKSVESLLRIKLSKKRYIFPFQ